MSALLFPSSRGQGGLVGDPCPSAHKCCFRPSSPPGRGEHLPAWGLRDDRIPDTDQAVRGGHHGLKLHSGFPPRQGDARGSADARSSADACLSWQKVHRREANRRRHRLTQPTTKALCQPPPPRLPALLGGGGVSRGGLQLSTTFRIRRSCCLRVGQAGWC